MRNILLRFNEEDELMKIIEEISFKLGISRSALARIALYNYCKSIKGGEDATTQ